jgi:putative tryptophan/tyrosine transport system substrate-binding protein
MQFGQLKRRDFFTLLGGATAWPLALRAQEPGRTYRLGGLTPSPRDAPHYAALFDQLRQLGFIEGQNLTIDWRGYGARTEQFRDIAAELVKAKPDVIFCAGDIAVRAAQQATTTIPILAVTDDMVGAGLVRSLAEPGGNTTGVSILATELDGKRQDILIEAVPRLRRMATLADVNTTTPQKLKELEDAARTRGVELSIHRVAQSEEVLPVIEAVKTSDAAALNVLASPLLFANRRFIIERAASLRLPAVHQFPEMAEDGGLIGYGPRLVEIFREFGRRQLVKLFRGAKPTDLPVEQPSHIEFVINLQTAKAIGHDVPPGLVLRADKVIE